MSETLATRPRAATASLSTPRSPRLRAHWPLAVLLLVATALRALALVAIYPGVWFSDSNAYITAAATGTLSPTRVDGYALVVAPFHALGSAGGLIVLQHALGLGLVAMLYALLVRRGATRWVALAAVVPAALDAYLLIVEHAVMAEAVYHAALFGALVLLLWPDRLGMAGALAAGLLFGYAGVVRSVAIPLVVLVVAYLLLRRVGPRPVLAFLLGWALVAGAYVGIFHAQHGTWGFTRSGGRFLYARVAPFAECDRLGTLPRDERSLCPDPARPRSTNAYLWGKTSPIAGLPDSADARLRDFARRVIRHQPLDYVRTVASGTLHYFRPGHPIGFNDYPIAPWQWPVDPHHWGYPGYRGPIRPSDPAAHAKHKLIEPGPDVSPMVSRPRLDAGASRVLHDYQRVAYTWGPLLALCLLLVLAALVLRRGAARLRLDAALLAALTLAALATSQALSVFSYRYGMIAIFGLPVAAALAATSLTRCSSTPPPTSP